MFADVLLDRGLGHDERLGDAAVGLALGHRARARRARAGVSSSSGPSARRRPSMRATISGSSALPPVGDALHGVDEARDVADALLEQVADALGVVADQVDA